MKICTITCQRVYNYGASLQAYALQHYLETLGHSVEIINFNPWFHCDRYNMFWNGSGRRSLIKYLVNGTYSPFTYLYKPLKAWRKGMFKTWGRKKQFDEFDKRFLHLTKHNYKTSASLAENPPVADVYVAGSDQIWNTFSNNGKEPAYYLDFGNHSTKRISYAASLSTSKIADGWESFVKEKVANLDCISVREKSGVQLLEALGVHNIHLVLDPVFLLKKEEWFELAKMAKDYRLSPNSYILVYDFLGNDASMQQFIKDCAKQKKLSVVSINDFDSRSYADVNINNAGPLEFLALLDNAAYVIANSFHATAFSVLFHKEFYTFGLLGHNNSNRMLDFLGELGLGDRFAATELQPEIDYDKVDLVLNKKKEDSFNYLINSINI